MELRIEINSKVVAWLASMGYPVSGMPAQLLRGMLLREARQWQLSPERLETMILENPAEPARRADHAAARLRDAEAVPRMSERSVSMLY